MALDLASATLAVGSRECAAARPSGTTKISGPIDTRRFGFINKSISRLFPFNKKARNYGLDRIDIFESLMASRINGMDSTSRVAATSFVRLYLDELGGVSLAKATGYGKPHV